MRCAGTVAQVSGAARALPGAGQPCRRCPNAYGDDAAAAPVTQRNDRRLRRVTGLAIRPHGPGWPRLRRAFEGRAMGSPLRLTLGRPGPRSIAPSPVRPQRGQRSSTSSRQPRRRCRGSATTSELTELNRNAGHRPGRPIVAASPPGARRGRSRPAADRRPVRPARPGRSRSTRLRGAPLAGAARSADRVCPIGQAGCDRTSPAPCRAATRVVSACAIGRPVDLGGIGKGLALRWAAARPRTIWASTDFLLEAGGDLVAWGRARRR